jgi:hypothetical protein
LAVAGLDAITRPRRAPDGSGAGHTASGERPVCSRRASDGGSESLSHDERCRSPRLGLGVFT